MIATAPAGAAWARVRISVATAASGTDASVARWDDLSFVQALFIDGFESGDTSYWGP